MSKQVTPNGKPRPVRSNALFLEVGLAKKISYQKSLATSKNPDFVSAHPNEVSGAAKQDFTELTKRVKKEFDSFLNVKAMRLRKRTGPRRIQA